MTMAEGMVRPDALSVRDGRLALAVHLPWYRSLPISCLESVDVTVDGNASDVAWDLRDPLDVSLDSAAQSGETLQLEVAVAVRIPYIQQAPGVPLVQRAVVRTEGTVQ
jgi:hypothetical protein